MKIIDKTEKLVSFEHFAEQHDLTLEMHERHGKYTLAGRYYCYFVNGEVSEPGVLVGTVGNGQTKEAAIQDYAHKLKGQLLVIDAYKSSRRSIQCPNEWAE